MEAIRAFGSNQEHDKTSHNADDLVDLTVVCDEALFSGSYLVEIPTQGLNDDDDEQ
jgi:hypothetical protein